MTEKLKRTIKEEVSKLAPEAQDAINAIDWISVTEKIGKDHRFNESQLNDFQVQTLLVLVGLVDIEEYIEGIEDEVGISKSDAEKISTELEQQVFKLVADILEDNIKKSLTNKKITWLQNIDFILSGGNYVYFLEDTANRHNSTPQTNSKILGTSNIIETKNKLINEV